MAIRVYRVAVVGCPHAAISQDVTEQDSETAFNGVGKSCLCNRFVRPEAYSESEHSSIMDEETWMKNGVFNGDHFVYWGAANKHLHDGTKVRFQVVEQTEIYNEPANNGGRLVALPSSQDYLSRASSTHFQSRTAGKEAYRLKATDEATKRTRGPVRTRQLFPNEDFGGNGGRKSMGIYGYVCVFDPTLRDAQMQKQLAYLSNLLPMIKKRKLVIACVKCDAVDEMQIRYGANLATYALKKTIPFVEVSARNSVNVEDAFFALVSPPKKSKFGKSSAGRRSSPFPTYHEVMESRKGDLTRAKDAYRKLLQRKVTEFSSQWRQVQPDLVREPEYQLAVNLTNKDSPEEIVKQMFQLRLIEIKLNEANSKFGSTYKKANKDRSSAHQIYLSEALRSHPDLGTDSMYDYVYSPGHSVSGDTETGDTEDLLTEPSTPSSHATTDFHGSVFSGLCENGALPVSSSRPRSATIPDMLVTVPSYDTSTLPPRKSSTDIVSPKMSTSLPRQPFTLPNGKEPPPLPPRDTAAMGTLKKDKATTKSQPFLENSAKQPGTLKREAEARRLSNSMDCLLLPEDDSENSQSRTSFSKLEAEPYLNPLDVQKVMGVALPSTSRNTSLFMSMRVSGKSRPVLPTFQDSVDHSSSMKRSRSFERGHTRSHSNPFMLELLVDGAVPPELPPRNMELPPAAPSIRSPQHRASRSPPPPLPPHGTEESSLEFGNGGRISVVSRISRARSPQAIVRELKEHTFINNTEDDNLSTISGPFEEIDADQPPVAGDHSMGTGIVRDLSSHTLPSQQGNDEEEDENDQYARIEDITKDQQYIAMAPAPANVNKGATLPVQRGSYLSGDDLDEEETRRAKSLSQGVAPTTPKKDSGVLARTVRRFRKQRTEPNVREATDSPSPPPPNSTPAHSYSSSVSTSILASPNRHSLPRPLPPSPTKGIKPQFNPASRKHSSGTGSNIYETIDEEMFSRVTGRSRRQAAIKDESSKSIVAPPVSQALMPKYFQVVQKFFSLPEIQAKWVEIVREVMPEEDAEDVPPPYYNTAVDNQKEAELDEKKSLSRIKSVSGSHGDDEIPIILPNTNSTPILQAMPAAKTSLITSPTSAFQSPRHTDMIKVNGGGSPLVTNPFIEFMNQQLHHQVSSDSETDSDEEDIDDENDEGASSDSDSCDSDVQHPKEEEKHRKSSITPQTDLDEALVLHNSISTDSDHIEADPVIKSPQSASGEELDREEKVVGVVEDHCVRPSQFLARKRPKPTSDQKVGGGSRTLRDSGISNQENNQSETEC